MLFTPEMDTIFPKMGSEVRKYYKQLSDEFEFVNDFTKVDQERLQQTYDLLESMKSIYVDGQYKAVYNTILFLLQYMISEGINDIAREKALRGFRIWSDKISSFKDRRMWWNHIQPDQSY